MIGLTELARRLNYHQVETEVADLMASFRAKALEFGQAIDHHLPDGPEKHRAVDYLDDLLKHVISGLARPTVADAAASPSSVAVTGCCGGQSSASGAQPVAVSTGTPAPSDTPSVGSSAPAASSSTTDTDTDSGSTETGTAEAPSPAPAAADEQAAPVTGTGA